METEMADGGWQMADSYGGLQEREHGVRRTVTAA